MESKFGTMQSQSWNDGRAEIRSGKWEGRQKELERHAEGRPHQRLSLTAQWLPGSYEVFLYFLPPGSRRSFYVLKIYAIL